MQIVNGQIVLGTKACHCGDGKVAGRKTCPACKGTRRGPRGGRGTCRQCYDGKTHDFENKVTCGNCNGTAIVPESLTDNIPPEWWQNEVTFKVIREEHGRFGFNESYLGLGYVHTCGDYGAAWDRNNPDELIAKVKEDTWVQATKIATKDGKVCDHIAILVTKNGYKVKAVFGDENPADNSTADRQVSQMFDPRKLPIAEAYVAADQR